MFGSTQNMFTREKSLYRCEGRQQFGNRTEIEQRGILVKMVLERKNRGHENLRIKAIKINKMSPRFDDRQNIAGGWTEIVRKDYWNRMNVSSAWLMISGKCFCLAPSLHPLCHNAKATPSDLTLVLVISNNLSTNEWAVISKRTTSVE